MAPPTGYKVNPDELFSHARAVAQLQQPLDRVVAATQEVSPGISVAYGLMCQHFALTLLPVREHAENAVEKISRSVDSAANQLIKAVDTYVHSDDKNSQQLRDIGENLPANAHNGLLAKNTRWDWKDYNPTDGGPLTQMEGKDRGKGAGIVGNTWDLVVEIRDSSKQNYGAMVGHIASIGADGAGFVGDPVASVAGWAAGWVMEHIKPFKLILDGLAGNPEMVEGASHTWKNIHKELERLADHYTAAVKHGAGGWDGEAGDSYRQNAAEVIIDAMKAAANLAEVLSILVGASGELVNLTRSAVRDLTAQAIGELVSAGVQRLIPYKPPFEELSNARYLLNNAKNVVKYLIVFVNHYAKQVPLVIEAFKTVMNIIPKLDGV
jgi:uncharacterized protein YukE